jgi:Asp-tRNA(Asn)/Glu-tRNA(Gln) amidotransferase A subunit family amidase
VVFDESILPRNIFRPLIGAVHPEYYVRQGVEDFLRDFGPAEYHSPADYEKAVGSPLPDDVLGIFEGIDPPLVQRAIETDSEAEKLFWAPQRAAVAAYEEPLDRLHLDGYVYPAIQMPPNDETILQPDSLPSSGPHSNTGWVNPLGVPAIVVPGGFYSNGLPFGLELSARRWRDGDLLGWAFAYEQVTKHRRPPVLVNRVVGNR